MIAEQKSIRKTLLDIESEIADTYRRELEFLKPIIALHAKRNRLLNEGGTHVRNRAGWIRGKKSNWFPDRDAIMKEMLHAGMSNTEIAGYLGISVNTIRVTKESQHFEQETSPTVVAVSALQRASQEKSESVEPQTTDIKPKERRTRKTKNVQPQEQSCRAFYVSQHVLPDGLNDVIGYITPKMTTPEHWNMLGVYVNYKISLTYQQEEIS